MDKKQKKEVWKILKELRHYCFICKEKLFLGCGQPKVEVGGCCIGADYNGEKWLFPLSAHYPCYAKYLSLPQERKDNIKFVLNENDIKKMLIPDFERHIKIEKSTLKEKFCKGKYREEIKQQIKQYINWIKELNTKKITQAKS